MTALSVDKPRRLENGFRVAEYTTAEAVHEGAALGEVPTHSGTVRDLVDGDDFVGFALRAAAAGERVTVAVQGVVELTISGIADTDIGAWVYATDSDTFAATRLDRHEPLVGKVIDADSELTNVCRVAFAGYQVR